MKKNTTKNITIASAEGTNILNARPQKRITKPNDRNADY